MRVLRLGQIICSCTGVRSGHEVTERGFSLVEALVATTLMVVGVVALAQLFTVATVSNMSASHATHATVLASQKLEELRALAWDHIRTESDADQVGAYTRRWTIAPLPADPDDTIVIQVSVTRGAGPSPEDARLVTLMTRATP